MTEPTPPAERPTLARYAEYLAGQQTTITDQWLLTVRRDTQIETADRIPTPQLVDHLPRLLRELCDFLRTRDLRRSSITLTEHRVDVAALVNDVVANVAPNIESRRQNLHISLPPAAVQLCCDPMRLAQILDNLLSNAHLQTADRGKHFPTGQHH